MAKAVADDAVQEQDLLRLRGPVRSYLSRAVPDEHELDDLVQETLLRVWEVRTRVERGAAASYAVATARNLVQSRERASQVHGRHAHRLHVAPTTDGPEVLALQREEERAAARVLEALRADDVVLLDDRDDAARAPGEAAPGEAARDEAASDGAARDRAVRDRTARRRSRLARARARARVDFLIALRRLDLPTSRCRPVLESLSSGDRRQQERAGAARHLLTCRVCASCAQPLLTRERRLFGVVALPVLLVLGPLRRVWARSPRASTATAGAVVTVVAAGAVLLSGGGDGGARPGAPPAPVAAAVQQPVRLDGASGYPVTQGGALPGLAGRQVVATAVTVRSVVSDEGFWTGPDDAHRLFVRLASSGESPERVVAGALVSFTGTVRPLATGVADGVTAAEGLGDLQAQGVYLDVPAAELRTGSR